MKPGDLPGLKFARERLIAVGRDQQVDDRRECVLALPAVHLRRRRPARARRSPLWEDLKYGYLGDLAAQRLKAAA
jgi:hypothetical protein